jgi:predicted transglutaminase-like cysteine proteinase
MAANGVQAKPAASPFLESGSETEAPRGFVEMCHTDASFCAVSHSNADPVVVTGDLSQPVTPDQYDMVPAPVQPDVWLAASPAFNTIAFSSFRSLTDTMLGNPIAIGSANLLGSALGVGGDCHRLDLSETAASRATAALAGGHLSAPLPLTFDWIAPPSAIASRRSDYCSASGDWYRSFPKAPIVRALPVAPVIAESATVRPAIDPGTDKADRALLKRINRYVNARVQQRTDAEIYGRDELWRRSGVGTTAKGDCEDIAIEKRFELTEAGFPRDRLSFAIVYSQQAGLHTVLVARMADGDVVLDSRNGFLVPWYKAAYSWISLQSTTDPMVWHTLDRQPLQS